MKRNCCHYCGRENENTRRRAKANQTSAGPCGLNCVQVAQLIAFATQSPINHCRKACHNDESLNPAELEGSGISEPFGFHQRLRGSGGSRMSTENRLWRRLSAPSVEIIWELAIWPILSILQTCSKRKSGRLWPGRTISSGACSMRQT